MKRHLILVVFLFGVSLTLKSQEASLLMRKIAQIPGHLSIFQQTREPVVYFKDYLPENFMDAGTNLVKNDSGFFSLIQGTGRVYKLDSSSGKTIWTRIDSTFFTGYNFGAYAFTRKNKLYSYGGHGFWQTNGQLREYNEQSKEWNALPLSRAIPWHKQFYRIFRGSTLCFYDSSNNRLYATLSNEEPNVFLKERFNKEQAGLIYSLDLDSGDWKELGKMNDTLFNFLGISPWGILSALDFVLDIKNNKYLLVNNSLRNRLNAILSVATEKDDVVFSFFRDSTLYIGRSRGKLDSVLFTRADLIDSGRPIYVPLNAKKISNNTEQLHYALIVFLGLTSIFLTVLYFRKGNHNALITNLSGGPSKNESDASLDLEKPMLFRSSKIMDLLEQRERSLLEFIYKHSLDERLTTIEEINWVIGVNNRSIEVQKRMRSDLIGSINQKLGLLTKDKKPVLDKHRSDFDKRSFEYFIQPEHMALVERVLNNG